MTCSREKPIFSNLSTSPASRPAARIGSGCAPPVFPGAAVVVAADPAAAAEEEEEADEGALA